MANKNELVKGLFAKKKHKNAPGFVICGISANRLQLIEYLQGRSEEWVYMQILEKKDASGYYVAENNWEKGDSVGLTTEKANINKEVTTEQKEEAENDLPF